MKPLLTLFDVAMSELSNDIKNSISVRCANMTLFAWTVTIQIARINECGLGHSVFSVGCEFVQIIYITWTTMRDSPVCESEFIFL